MNKTKLAGIILIILIIGGISYYASHRTPQGLQQVAETNNEPSADQKALKATIASLALEKEDFNGAIKASDDYIKKYGDDVDVWIHRGMSYYQLQDCTNASTSLYHAVQMNTASESMSVEDINALFASVLNSDLCKK